MEKENRETIYEGDGEEIKEEATKKIVAGESIGIKEGERIGLGLRNMQTQADIERKKKKRRKKIGMTLVILLLLVSVITVVYLKKQSEETADTVESSEDVVPGDNQELVFGEITAIQGNEITYEPVEEDNSTEQTEKSEEGTHGDMSQSGRKTMQDVEELNKEDISTADNNEQKNEENSMSEGFKEDAHGEDTTNNMPATGVTKTYHSLGKDPVQITIPVGTDVVTKLGTITTFARLATGDVVQMLMEKDGEEEIIVKLWIVG